MGQVKNGASAFSPAYILEQLKIHGLVPKSGDTSAAEAVVSSVRLAIMESDKLQALAVTREGQTSIIYAVAKAVQVGLSLNPQEGLAALVPYEKTVSYQIMKNGLIQLAIKGGDIISMTVDTIYQNDEVEIYKSGEGDYYKLTPNLVDRGSILGYLSAVILKDNRCQINYMTAVQAAEHRKEFSKKSVLSPEHYGKKTVQKRLLTDLNLPNKSKELAAGLAADGYIADAGARADEIRAFLGDEPLQTKALPEQPVAAGPAENAPLPAEAATGPAAKRIF